MGQLQFVKVSSITLYTKEYVSSIDIGPTAAPPTTCSDLIALTNGMISYNMGTASLRPVNTVTTYTCNPGYTLNGDTTRTCESNGVWSGSYPVCQRKWNLMWTNYFVECTYFSTGICFDLPSLTNGRISYSEGSPDNRRVNTIAFYSCNTGYTLTGGRTFRFCVSGGRWDGLAPVCQGEFCNSYTVFSNNYVDTYCSDLTNPTNGMIGYNMGTASLRPVSTVATYTCDTGYTLNHDTTRRVCVIRGIWTGSAPTCQS